jgi:hypothetical protein
MEKQPEALRLAEQLETEWPEDCDTGAIAAELRRLHAENEVLLNALWKACGDDEDVVNATIESQR